VSDQFKAPVGTRDVLPPESSRWQALVAAFAQRANRAGYGLIQTPLFEDVAVFERVGESTDVVRKEMYDFDDKGGRRIALRPEGTAGVVRAFVQHRPQVVPWKVWYVAPNFRYERPQAGRYRQHFQVGVEALGTDDPDVDVEVIAVAWELYRSIGLRRVVLLLNSLGDPQCRPQYLDALRSHLRERRGDLCDEHRERFEEAPLRVLDCKRAACRTATADAPRMIDHLCDDCRAHFEAVQRGLGALRIPFVIETRLVRGLDYYTRTTFEFQADALESAQNAIGGGGRYDRLAESLGGPPSPGIGFGSGIERVLLACDAEDVFPAPEATVDVWVVDMTGTGAALTLSHQLRDAGVSADRAFGGTRSVKSQMKAANRSGARVAVIVGEQELADGTVTLRDLRSDREQEVVPREKLTDVVKEWLHP
jgi:histidyl-tRNA synthetase